VIAKRRRLPKPELNSIDPTSGPYNGGNWISFNGANFTTSCEVVWYNIPLVDAKYRYCSPNTMILCEVPKCQGEDQRQVPVQVQNTYTPDEKSDVRIYKYNEEEKQGSVAVATQSTKGTNDNSDLSVTSLLFHSENLLTITTSQPRIEENLSSDEIDEVNNIYIGTTLCFLTNIIRKR
jgi:hypothetical protein